jgi:hypothetical protein
MTREIAMLARRLGFGYDQIAIGAASDDRLLLENDLSDAARFGQYYFCHNLFSGQERRQRQTSLMRLFYTLTSTGKENYPRFFGVYRKTFFGLTYPFNTQSLLRITGLTDQRDEPAIE